MVYCIAVYRLTVFKHGNMKQLNWVAHYSIVICCIAMLALQRIDNMHRILIYCKLQRMLFKQTAQVLLVGTKICKVINCNIAHFLEKGPFEIDPKGTGLYLHIKSPTFSAIYCAIYVVYLILHWAGKRPRTERI